MGHEPKEKGGREVNDAAQKNTQHENASGSEGSNVRALCPVPDTQVEPVTEGISLFKIQTATQWIDEAKTRPTPKMLFSEFWHENELCILFADTNLGKSILAVQIADSISRGKAIPGFRLEAQPQKVLCFDFELSDKQFENRYSKDYRDHYTFSENFLRAEIDPSATVPDTFDGFEAFLNHSIEQAIRKTEAKILIIDNLTYLRNDAERAKDALPLMKDLQALKKKHSLSMLALAHTPKRDQSRPITLNDLQGSKMLMNFCDSSFAVGISAQDKNVRYLKQIKVRATENIYDAENVCICQVVKPDNFLLFEFLSYGREADHLRQQTDTDQENLIARVKYLRGPDGGCKSYRHIGEELGISHMKVKRILEQSNMPV